MDKLEKTNTSELAQYNLPELSHDDMDALKQVMEQVKGISALSTIPGHAEDEPTFTF